MLNGIPDDLKDALPGWQLSEREVAWLWYFLAVRERKALDDSALNSPLMREQLASHLKSSKALKERVERERDMQLLPENVFQWIKRNERLEAWLQAQALKLAGTVMLQGPLRSMTGKDEVIAIFDIWESTLTEKEQCLQDLERKWHQHLQSDKIFRWFKQGNEKEKCTLAWDWIEKNKPSLIRRASPIASHSELLIFFDKSKASHDEKKLYVDAIKRRWSTQQYRERTPNRKQYNFVLSDEVNAALDKLAQQHHTSRTKVLEQLIQNEIEHGLYLSKPN